MMCGVSEEGELGEDQGSHQVLWPGFWSEQDKRWLTLHDDELGVHLGRKGGAQGPVLGQNKMPLALCGLVRCQGQTVGGIVVLRVQNVHQGRNGGERLGHGGQGGVKESEVGNEVNVDNTTSSCC